MHKFRTIQKKRRILTQNLLQNTQTDTTDSFQYQILPSQNFPFRDVCDTKYEKQDENSVDLYSSSLGSIRDAKREIEELGWETLEFKSKSIHEYITINGECIDNHDSLDRFRTVLILKSKIDGKIFITDDFGKDFIGISEHSIGEIIGKLKNASKFVTTSKCQPKYVTFSHQVSGALFHEIIGHAFEADNEYLLQRVQGIAFPSWLTVVHDPLATQSWQPREFDDSGSKNMREALIIDGAPTGRKLGPSLSKSALDKNLNLRMAVSNKNLIPRFSHLDVFTKVSSNISEFVIENFYTFSINRRSGVMKMSLTGASNGTDQCVPMSFTINAQEIWNYVIGCVPGSRTTVNVCGKLSQPAPVSYYTPQLIIDWKRLCDHAGLNSEQPY